MKDSTFSSVQAMNSFLYQEHVFFLDLRMLTEANINSAWQSVLPKRQDTKALGTDAIAWR